MSAIPLSLYVHFPWCIRKCPYCDFNSHTLKQDLPEKKYIDALIHDLRAEQQGEERRDLKSVFLGGGTPSLFSGDAVDQLLKHIEEFFSLTSSEITIEANPGTYDQSNFLTYRRAGVNRLSLGAQSFNQRVRWTNTKEEHASRIIEVVSTYFLTQKLKPVKEKAKNKAAYKDYIDRLVACHKVMRKAMKVKQTVDPAAVDKLNAAIKRLGELYK